MAIAFVAAASKNDESFPGSGAALTGFNLDCTGADFALVFVAWANGAGHTVDSVTIGGNAMSAVAAAFTPSGHSGQSMQWFYYANPGTGNQSIVVDPSTGSFNRAAVVGAVCYSGVDTASPIANVTTTENAGGVDSDQADITVSSATGDFVVCGVSSINNVTVTCDTGNERVDTVRTTNGTISGAISDEAGAASVTAEHTTSAAADWGIVGFSLQADAGGTDKTDSDTGAWEETPAETATYTETDSGAFTDTEESGRPVSDPGGFSDSPAETAAYSEAESGGWVDLDDLLVALGVSDAGSWAETADLTLAQTDSDTGAWGDTANPGAAYGETETAGLGEAQSETATASPTDTGGFAEAATVTQTDLFNGVVSGTATLSARMAGTVTQTARIAGTTTLTPRLGGTTDTSP